MGGAGCQDRTGFPIVLTEDEQRAVNGERDSHPEAHVRRKMLNDARMHEGPPQQESRAGVLLQEFDDVSFLAA
jgi:hypothetical protein